MRVVLHLEDWPSIVPFRIANNAWGSFPCLVCEIQTEEYTGRGEALGIYYLDETPESMHADIESIIPDIKAGATRHDLLSLLPHGGARLAVDAALWDLEAQQTNRSAWNMAGVSPDPVETVFTIGLEDTPEQMAKKAVAAKQQTLFKVKLNNDRPVERIAAIRKARPDARLVVDVNEGWTFAELTKYDPALDELGVSMLEQPLPRDNDADLEHYQSKVPLCADESCLHLGEFEKIPTRYQMLNIKLDKAGGLTHALILADAAKNAGMDLMVGCMGGTSLSMAPAHVLAQLCDVVDLDGPLLIKNDRPGGLHYERGWVRPPLQRFWGQPVDQ